MPGQEGLYDFVKGGYDVMQEYADEAFDAAMDFLEELARQSVALELPDITYEWKAMPVIPDISTSVPPTEPVIEADFPNKPSEFIPGTITPPTFDDAPEYDVNQPTVVLPGTPPPLDAGDVPLVPDTDLDLDYPVPPDYALPDLPVFEDVTIPAAPPIDFPAFTETPPDDSDLVAPGITFNFIEEEYNSTLLDSVTNKLINDITVGGTGLSVVVEQAIWDRERNREDQVALKAKAELLNDTANRGYTLPPGVEARGLQEIAQETANKLIDLGRDVMIKQADLEQENVRFAVGEAIKLETTLLNLWNETMQRKFSVAQYTQEVAINIFNTKVALYSVQLEAYNIAASVYNTLIQAELGKLEVYKAEIDAQRLINEINETSVQIYKTQVDALVAQSQLYKTEMEAVRLQLDAEKTKIDVYLGEIQGYTATIEAKKAEYDIYSAQIDGELAKVRVYEAEVSAYSERMKAYSSEVDAKASVSNVQIAQEQLRLDSYSNRLDAYKTEVEAEATRLNATVTTYETQVKAFSATVDANSTLFESYIARFNAALSENETAATIELQKATSNVTKIIEQNKVLIETIKTGGMLASEVAAAALAAINLSAGMTAQGGEFTNHNYSYEG